MNINKLVATCILPALLQMANPALAQTINGFDLSNSSIPVSKVLTGGPPRDGIPSIDNPVFDQASDAGWLVPEDRVIGVERKGIAKAYPIRILNWHEIVNDKFDGEAVLVTFCPLCGTGIVFAPGNGDFGVSGLLYNSDVLLYDRATESLWSQILATSISGPRLGEKLTVLPSLHTTWEQWQEQRPDTLVLSRDTGHVRDYDRDPYAGYANSASVFFPVDNQAPASFHAKERVLGLKFGDVAKAYPFSVMQDQGKEKFKDTVNEREIVVHWNESAPTAWITTSDGEEVPVTDSFWFAWYAFHPDTEVYEP